MKQCIFRMPIEMTQFDWTFDFGSATYEFFDLSHIKLVDVMTQTDDQAAKTRLLGTTKLAKTKHDDDSKHDNESNPNDDDTAPAEIQEEEKSLTSTAAELVKSNRDKAGQILISWLVTCTELEYVTSVDPTPGTVN